MTGTVSIGEVIPLPRNEPDRADLAAVVPARAERGETSADFGNVVPFARPRDARNAPEVALPADLARPSGAVATHEWVHWRSLYATCRTLDFRCALRFQRSPLRVPRRWDGRRR